jgi:hypothetical protein
VEDQDRERAGSNQPDQDRARAGSNQPDVEGHRAGSTRADEPATEGAAEDETAESEVEGHFLGKRAGQQRAGQQ